jgi:hypothetical protein
MKQQKIFYRLLCITLLATLYLLFTTKGVNRMLREISVQEPKSNSISSTSTGTDTSTQSQEREKTWSDIKLVIYMTTHLPKIHEKYLPCWKDAIQRLEIFKYADLILYTSRVPTVGLLKQLPFRNTTVKMYNNSGYQSGAIQAMIDPFVDDVTWFDGYDWVIRLNPDVLIRNDTWLMRTMLDPTMNGIFHNCVNRNNTIKLHTDFYAFRPSAIDRQLVLRSLNTENAEYHMTAALRNIYDSQQFAYIEGAENPKMGICRMVGVNSPVIHSHETWKECPNYYNFTEDGMVLA